mgnify:CR=1 FL=1
MQDAVGRGARTSPVEGCGLLAGRTASRRRAGVKEKSCGPAAAFFFAAPATRKDGEYAKKYKGHMVDQVTSGFLYCHRYITFGFDIFYV